MTQTENVKLMRLTSQENSTTSQIIGQKPIKRKVLLSYVLYYDVLLFSQSLEPDASPTKKKLFQRTEIKWP